MNNAAKLLTVRRTRGGVFAQTIIEILGDDGMKLKCNLCEERNGAAVKTDQLVIVTVNGHDKLACVKCADRIKGVKSHENANSDRQS